MDKITLGPTIDYVAVDLYQGASCVYTGGGGYVLSPLSILYAGALMYFGANGPTKDNLNTVLHFRTGFGNKSDIIKGVFENNAKMLSLGELQDPKKSTTPDNYKMKAQVALLNGLFYDPSLKIKADFVKSIQQTLKAGVYEQALGKSTEAEKSMNDWVTVNTFGKINNLVPSKSITPKSNIALINTLYFKSSWNVGFPTPDAKKDAAPFYHLDGNVSQPLYLTASRGIPYAEDNELDVQYVELPYKGDDYYLSIILPRQKDGIRNCEHQLNSHALRELRGKVPALKAGHQRVVNLKIPKFRVEGYFDLAKLLAKAGVTHALGPQADFSQMAGEKPTFSNMFHKAAFEINEFGTEAAAESKRLMTLTKDTPPPGASWEPDYAPVDFIADHPFVFALQHRPTESLLFIGRVESPTQPKQ